MTNTYIAWNGDEYPLPAPDGWAEKSDGRYWPADQGPPVVAAPPSAAPAPAAPAPAAPAPTPPAAIPPPAAPAPFAAPAAAPSPGGFPPPSAAPAQRTPTPAPPSGGAPPPAAGPPPRAAAPPAMPVKGSNKKTYIVLAVVLGFIVLSVGSCIAFIARAGEDVFDAFETLANENQNAIESVDFDTCGVEGNEIVAAGTVKNDRDINSSYDFTVVFVLPDGTRNSQAVVDIGEVPPGDKAPFRVTTQAVDAEANYTCEVTFMTVSPLRFGN